VLIKFENYKGVWIMNHVRNSKKTLILAAVVSIMTLSVASSSQTNALTLSEFLNNTFNNQAGRQDQNNNQSRPVAPMQTQTQTQNQTPSRQNTPTQNVVEQILPTNQQPAQTAPVTQTPPTQTPAPAQTRTQTATPQATAARTLTPASPVIAPLDTSAAVVNTANAQAVGESAPNASPYTSNKIDPMLAQKLLFAGIATITAGTLIYAASIFPYGKKQVRHIPVKSL
jgi:hypothetical protein